MNQKYCSNCGKLISSDSNFCTYCGVPTSGKGASAFRANDPIVTDSLAIEQMVDKANNNIPQHSSQDEPFDYKSLLMPKQHLGNDAIMYFFVNFLGKSIVLFGLMIVGMVFMPLIFVPAMITYLIIVLITALIVHNNFVFEINDSGLRIEKGVLHKYSVTVPFDQVQNVNIERSLMDRFLGFSRVSIETAGGSATPTQTGAAPKAEAYIPAIHMDKAKKIHDLLLDGADGVIDSK